MVDQKECSVAKKRMEWPTTNRKTHEEIRSPERCERPSWSANFGVFMPTCCLLVGTIHRVLSVFPHNVFGNPPTKYSLIGLGVYIEACRSNKPGPMMAIYFNLFFSITKWFSAPLSRRSMMPAHLCAKTWGTRHHRVMVSVCKSLKFMLVVTHVFQKIRTFGDVWCIPGGQKPDPLQKHRRSPARLVTLQQPPMKRMDMSLTIAGT